MIQRIETSRGSGMPSIWGEVTPSHEGAPSYKEETVHRMPVISSSLNFGNEHQFSKSYKNQSWHFSRCRLPLIYV